MSVVFTQTSRLLSNSPRSRSVWPHPDTYYTHVSDFIHLANANLPFSTYPLQNPHHILRKHPHNLRRQRQRNNHNRQKHTPHRHKKNHISHRQNSHRPIIRLLHHFRQTKQESTQPEDPFEESGEHDAADDGDVDDVLDGPCRVGRRSVEEGRRHCVQGMRVMIVRVFLCLPFLLRTNAKVRVAMRAAFEVQVLATRR
jgi:hypothetical protein